MRVVYLDESGISRREPVLVVAAIIAHGDTQVIPVEDHLERLVQKHIPEENREGFFSTQRTFMAVVRRIASSTTKLNGPTRGVGRFLMILSLYHRNSVYLLVSGL